MNKTHRSVWNARKQTYVAAAETVAAKGKPCSGTQAAAVASAVLGGLLSLSAHAQTAPPPNTLPTGGQVSAGQAAIGQSGANMVIQQGSERAAINWQSFNVGADAHVQFQQPSAASVTLNRVMSADPSQIFGRISANGQVVLTNPQGVYFGRSARVDVGGLVATTNSISDDNFMAGNNRYERNGSTGAVINEGELKAALGGYIALLAPEVRNQGAVIAQMGTVALAAGEAVDLHFDSQNRLTSIRVEPAQIQTLVDNRHAVQAPGGLIILSAQSMDRLLGGVVKNSGRIEANGLQQQGGRIVLSASKQVDNSGVIAANAVAGATPADIGPAGQVSLSAPEVINSGSISASGAAGFAAGSVRIEAERFEQTASASVRAEAPTQGGQIRIVASGTAQLAGELSVAAQPVATAPATTPANPSAPATPQTATPPSTGGEIEIEAAHITLDSARLDASGDTGGTLRLHANGANANTPASSAPATPAAPNAPLPSDPREPGHLAVLGSSSLSTRGRSGRGGLATLTGDDIALQDATSIDASGATGGGAVLVGGDWQGGANAERRVFADPDALYQATTVRMDAGASIDASATVQGDGGTVVLWSDLRKADSLTTAHGSVLARGGAQGGNGGQVETSASTVAIEGFRVDTLAPQGQAGLWLIDPFDYNINAAQASAISTALNTSSVTVTTVNNDVGQGSNGNNSSAGDINVNSSITKTSGGTTTLTLEAARHIRLRTDATITSTNGALNLSLQADTDNNGDGIVFIEGAGISTNGGNLTFGGSGRTANIGGSTVRVGGDVFFQRGSAQTLSTGGGALNVWGETIVSNTAGLTVNSGGGNVTFNGLLNSGNAYSFESRTSGGNWDDARVQARAGSFGSAVNDSYLVTITSRLENSIAGLTANYQGAWIGAYRANTNSYAWSWADGPETGQVFFTQSGSGGIGGGAATVGYYANFATGEPNGNLDGNRNNTESVGQFFGSAGLWNDLAYTTQYSATQSSEYAVLGFVRETNLAASPVTISAGAGAVTFNGSVGGSKALVSLNVTSSSTAVNGAALLTTGAQTYSSGLTVNAASNDLRLQATGITVGGAVALSGANIALNANLTSTAAGAAILARASGNVVQGNVRVLTHGGDVTYWADSDNNGSGGIQIQNNTQLSAIDTRTNSDRTATTNTTGGGTITLAGGLDDGGTNAGITDGRTANDGRPDGFATNLSGTTRASAGVLLGNDTGLGQNTGIKLYSGSGDIVIHGRSTANINNLSLAVMAYQGLDINAGTTGNISLVGRSTAVSPTSAGTDLAAFRVGSTPHGASTWRTHNGNITLVGSASNGTGENLGIAMDADTSTDRISLIASGTGAISVTGTATGTASSGIRMAAADFLAASGNISLIATSGTINAAANGFFIGAKAGVVDNSSSNILMRADSLTFNSAAAISSTGTLTVEPSAASFSSALTWPLTNLTATGLTGLTLGKVGNTSGITIGSAQTINGFINVYGGNIAVNAALTATAGDILLDADNGIQQSYSGRGVNIAAAVTTINGNITIEGRGGNTSGDQDGVYVDNVAVTAGGTGTVSVTGRGGASTGDGNVGVRVRGAGGLITSNNGNVTVTGTGGGAGATAAVNYGVLVTQGGSIRAGGSGALAVTGTGGSAAGWSQWGIRLDRGVIASAGGAITLTGFGGGLAGSSRNHGISIGDSLGSTVGSATSGDIALNGTAGTAAGGSSSEGISLEANTVLGAAGYAGNVTLNADSLAVAATTVTSTGALTVQPLSTSFSSALNWPISGLTLSADLTGLTLGKAGNTADITIGSATSIAGPISVYGGNININQSLSTTAAGDVLVRGSGAVTIAATTGGVSTSDGNITVTGSRFINNRGATALAAGGVGKAWQVWSGNANPFGVGTPDVAGGLVFDFKQYNATFGSSTVLGTGSGLLYSLAPTLTATLGGTAVTKAYDGTLAATLVAGNFSSSGAVDGDLGLVLSNPTSGTYASKDVGTGIAVTASGVTVLSATSSVATGEKPVYGYAVTGGTATGNIGTIEAKVLTATATAANKTYDGDTTAVASLTLSGLVGTETLGVTNSASFNSKDVLNANLVTVNSTTLGNGTNGGLASNYSLASVQPVAASITARTVGLSASKTYDGTTDLAGAVTLSGLVAGEALTYTGAVASDKHVATSGKFVSAIALADGTGGLASNYLQPTLNAANASVTIAAATLSPTLINAALSKIYDGTTDAPAGFVPQWSFGGLVAGDSAASLSLSAASFNSATVAGANLLTVSGLAIDAITGSNGSLASDYLLDATSKTAAASITRANLVVSANDDARFVTQTDAVGFAGVGYAGWVNGEGSSVLGGALAIARSNAGTNTAGSYVGVLQASGFTADNYAISYTAGSYTIVGANELLVRVADVTNFYGTTTPYSISGASYLASDNTTIVNLSGNVSGSANSFTINDGVGGSASFNLVPVAAQTAGSGALAAGSYQLGQSGAVFVNGANFSNTVRVVGSHQVNAKGLTATAAGLSKIYDGNTSMTGVSLGLAGLETGDTVTVSGLGAFDNRNAGVGKTFSISNLALAGGDAANYFLLSGSGFSGNNASITAKAVTLAPQAVTRVYNGVSAYTSGAADLSHLSGLLGVAGDTVTAATLAFDTKNVGNGKTLTASAVTIADGNGGNNYSVTLGANSTSAITRLNSVTWIGGTTGNWFDPANWAGGAVPDLSNVANVVIPSGTVVSFDTTGAVAPADSGAPVNVDSLGNAGSLTQNSGTLNVGTGGILLASLTQTGGTLGNGGTTVVDSFDQTGGSFSGTGAMTVGLFSQTGGTTTLGSDLTVSQGFSQGSSGSVAVGGNAQITDTSGGVQLGNLTSSGTLAVNSTDGAITQAAGTAIAALSTSSFTATQGGNPADVTLANAGNDFTGAVSLSGAAVQIADTNALTLGNVTTTGDLTVNSTGALNLGTTSVGGGLNANSGNGDISQSGPLAVNGSTTLAAGAGDITLSNPANDFGGTVNATGADIALADANALTLGNVTASGNLDATAGTDLALNGTVNAASLDLQATNGSISQGTSNTLTVTNGPTNLGAAGNINLSNPGNDFNGTVNAAGTGISLADANTLTLGTVAASGNLSLQSSGNLDMGTTTVGGTLNANSGNGNITQTGSLTVAGLATLQAGSGAVLLNNPGNRLPQGVVVTAASSSITGDAQAGSRAVVEQVIGATPVVPMPGVNVFDQALPPPLVMALADGAAPAGGATGVARAGNSAGVIVALADQPGADGVVVVAVSVPKGAAATGFGFALPKSVLDLLTTGVPARASLPDGSALPSWLRFDPLTLRFDASAAPAGAIPAEVLLMVGDQRVRIVISERKG